jgi:hypothetical protein
MYCKKYTRKKMSGDTMPKLVEPNVRYFIDNSLKSVHEYRMNNYSFFLNVSAVVFFVLVFGGVLYYRFKSKPTPYEIQQKMKRDQEIIMSKIQMYQDDKKRGSYSEMTKMPFVDTDYYVRKHKET